MVSEVTLLELYYTVLYAWSNATNWNDPDSPDEPRFKQLRAIYYVLISFGLIVHAHQKTSN